MGDLETWLGAVHSTCAVLCKPLEEYGIDAVEDDEKLLEQIVGLDRETHIIVGEVLPVWPRRASMGSSSVGCSSTARWTTCRSSRR